jgi:hypothetical protein
MEIQIIDMEPSSLIRDHLRHKGQGAQYNTFDRKGVSSMKNLSVCSPAVSQRGNRSWAIILET